MKLIDADALEAKLEEQRKLYIEMDMKGAEHLLVHDVLHHVWEAPTIDPVRHGRWVVIDAEEPRRYGCSECKRLSWHMENYCPNCGAFMDKEKRDDED